VRASFPRRKQGVEVIGVARENEGRVKKERGEVKGRGWEGRGGKGKGNRKGNRKGGGEGGSGSGTTDHTQASC